MNLGKEIFTKEELVFAMGEGKDVGYLCNGHKSCRENMEEIISFFEENNFHPVFRPFSFKVKVHCGTIKFLNMDNQVSLAGYLLDYHIHAKEEL